MSTDTDRQAWGKREDETSRANEVFCVYRELGPREPSLQKVCDELGKKSVYVRHLERWSSDHDWPARAAAWNEHMAEKRREESEKEITTGLSQCRKRQATVPGQVHRVNGTGRPGRWPKRL